MTQLYIRRKFVAAHFLPDHPGQCRNMHGHTWKVEVWMRGNVDPKTGMVADFGDAKRIIDLLDHTTLNNVLPLGYLPPTTENVVRYFLEYIPYAYRVRVWESDDCYAEDWAGWGERELPFKSFVKGADYDSGSGI